MSARSLQITRDAMRADVEDEGGTGAVRRWAGTVGGGAFEGPGILVFLARDAEQRVLRYAHAGVTKGEQAGEKQHPPPP